MTDYDTVRIALGEALRTRYQYDLNIFDHVPRTLVPPAAIVKPRPKVLPEYRKAMGRSSLARWQFEVLLIIGLVDEVASQKMAGELISPGSPLVNALTCKILNGYSQVTDAGTSEMMVEDDGLYTYAELTVEVLA